MAFIRINLDHQLFSSTPTDSLLWLVVASSEEAVFSALIVSHKAWNVIYFYFNVWNSIFESYHTRVMEWALKECGFVNLSSNIFQWFFFFIIGIMLILYLENMMLVLRRFGLICYRLNNILASYYFDTIVEISYLLIW